MDKKVVAAGILAVVGGLSLYGGLGGFDSPLPEAKAKPAEIASASPAAGTPAKRQETIRNSLQKAIQNGNPVHLQSSLGGRETRPTTKATRPARGSDQPFEDWLWQFGYDLNSADVVMYLRTSAMSSERRARLLEFALAEVPEVAHYFASKDGIDFLDSLLEEKNLDPTLATRIGHTLRWLNREHAGEADDNYMQRFSEAKTPQEKAGLVAAISDPKFLRDIAYNHKEDSAIRSTAIHNLLAVQKDPKTLKQLLDLTETQPELSRVVLRSSASSAGDLDEFMTVVEVLRKEGIATPQNASLVGESFAKNPPAWLGTVEQPTDPFVKQVLQAYSAKWNTSARDTGFKAP